MTPTPTPSSGAADLPEALRVPLDSLHADAGYLCGRLLNGSLTQEQVVESIHRRIDAAKLAALAAGQATAAQAGVPAGWKLVQIELLERIQESLGSFISDQGWSQSDMDTADALDGLLAAVPQPPACNQSMQPELATYSAQARNKKGIEQ